MKCECGNDKFYAHQIQHCDVIVDENNNWEENAECYDTGAPYGPYTCTKCGKEYDKLEK